MAEDTKPTYLPLPEEPKGSRETICRIGVRLPNGRKLQRTFLRTDPVKVRVEATTQIWIVSVTCLLRNCFWFCSCYGHSSAWNWMRARRRSHLRLHMQYPVLSRKCWLPEAICHLRRQIFAMRWCHWFGCRECEALWSTLSWCVHDVGLCLFDPY